MKYPKEIVKKKRGKKKKKNVLVLPRLLPDAFPNLYFWATYNQQHRCKWCILRKKHREM